MLELTKIGSIGLKRASIVSSWRNIWLECQIMNVFVIVLWISRKTSQPDMNDRDIPSVPVTTLAGLASVSDCKRFSHSDPFFSWIWDINLWKLIRNFSAKRASNIRVISRIAVEKVIAFSSASCRRSKPFAVYERWSADTPANCSTWTN